MWEDGWSAIFLAGFLRTLAECLEIGIPRCAREGDHVTDIFKAGEIHHHSFQSKAKTGVGDGAVPAQVEIPPISFFIQAAVTEPL